MITLSTIVTIVFIVFLQKVIKNEDVERYYQLSISPAETADPA